MKKIALTGIKPTGIPHLGNYLGAIKPALTLSETCEARYFIADYHALNACKDPVELKKMTIEIAAAWLACGLDPEKTLFYRQSDVPETFELLTILMAFTPKGLMNRAHAYKAILQNNLEAKRDPDDGVNMGLYTYPVLMAADILLFDTDFVPVGTDQYQHIEMAQDIAQSFNFVYQKKALKIPQPMTQPNSKIVVGLDGRKMSKSYNNTIPMFCTEKELKRFVMSIKTNSQTIEEPKDPESSHIFTLYKNFASPEQIEKMRQRYLQGGLGWGQAKMELFEVINSELSPLRENYNYWINNQEKIWQALKEGSEKARALASQKIKELRQVIGID